MTKDLWLYLSAHFPRSLTPSGHVVINFHDYESPRRTRIIRDTLTRWRFLESQARCWRWESAGSRDSYQSKLQIPSNNGVCTREKETGEGGSFRPLMRAVEREIVPLWPSAESIKLIYLPFIRPSAAPPDVSRPMAPPLLLRSGTTLGLLLAIRKNSYLRVILVIRA